MFERFTPDAKAAVIAARAHARRLGHRWVGTEHLLRAIVDGAGPGADALAAMGIGPQAVEHDLVTFAAPTRETDRRALASIGIDLDRVLDAAGLRDGDDRDCAPVRRWRRRRKASTEGSPRFSPRAKRTLELALREALRLGDRGITAEHVLLGILREGRGVGVRFLVDRGVSIDTLRRELERVDRGRAAS